MAIKKKKSFIEKPTALWSEIPAYAKASAGNLMIYRKTHVKKGSKRCNVLYMTVI